MDLERRHPDGRIEAILQQAERHVDNNSPDGYAPHWGGMIRQLIAVIMDQSDEIERMKYEKEEDHGPQGPE